MSKIVITGTGGTTGLGHLIAQNLTAAGHDVIGLTLGASGRKLYAEFEVDVTNWEVVDHMAGFCSRSFEAPVEIVINCAGMNRIGMLEDFLINEWDDILNVNTRGIFYTSKAFLKQLKETKGTICNIVSVAAYTPMTASLAYNASKGAAHIMTLQLARELTRRHDITVFGIGPNRLKGTVMSEYIDEKLQETRGWSLEEAQAYQRAALLNGEEVDPQDVANLLTYLLASKENHRSLTGCIWQYGA